MEKGAMRTNANRVPHTYHVGDLVLIRRDVGGEILGKLAKPTHGPYNVEQVYANGTVRINRGRFSERINIRRLLPYRRFH